MSDNQPETDTKKKKKKLKNRDGQKEECVNADTNSDVLLEKETEISDREPLHTSMEHLQVAAKSNNAMSVACRKAAGSNWKAQLEATSGSPVRDALKEDCDVGTNEENISKTTLSKTARHRQKRKTAQFNKYVAMDCEMVGVGFNGQEDMLARVSVVNKRGDVLLDKFVKASEAVTDYRTSVSGIRPHDIHNGEDFKTVQEEVVQLIQGKILVGHAIRNDLAVLHIKHPYANIRDTARYKPLCRLVANGRTPSLKRLSQAILGQEIQTGEHNSVEDARAAMNIYNRLSRDWEMYLKKHQRKKM